MSRIKEYLMELEDGRIVPGDIQDKSVCAAHFESLYLQDHIKENGDRGKCAYCGEHSVVIPMSEFIKLVRQKIESEFDNVNDAGLPTERSYFDDDEEEIPGLKRFMGFTAPSEAQCFEDTEEVLDTIDLCPKPDTLYNDLLESLPSHGWISSDPFIISRDQELSLHWKSFSDMVKHRQRFTFWTREDFRGNPSHYDNCLMDILHELSSLIHEADLCKILDADRHVVRARPISTTIPCDFKEITSPSDDKAWQNRMSPAGISMFYGGFDEETVRRECTPMSHHDGKGRFLIGRFRIKHPLFILDLTEILKPLFWEQQRDYREKLSFLHMFSEEISKPIVPDDRIHTEYVPTQVFTEYLRFVFKYGNRESLDGIKYKSSINGRPCIVLFCNQKESEGMLELVEIKDITCA